MMRKYRSLGVILRQLVFFMTAIRREKGIFLKLPLLRHEKIPAHNNMDRDVMGVT
jgi:hypothetical protein